MKDVILRLAAIADDLDNENMVKEADVVIGVMKKLAERFELTPESAWITKCVLDFDHHEVILGVSNEPDSVYVYRNVDPELMAQIKRMHDAGERIGSILKREVMEYPHVKMPVAEPEEEFDPLAE